MSRIELEIVGDHLPGRECPPHREIDIGLQVGKETTDVFPADATEVRWDVVLERRPDGDWRGKAVHGKRGERFLYLVWREATPNGPQMFRRAKLQLDAIPAGVVAAAEARGQLSGRLGLTDAHGMPRCASVRPPIVSWSANG